MLILPLHFLDTLKTSKVAVVDDDTKDPRIVWYPFSA